MKKISLTNEDFNELMSVFGFASGVFHALANQEKHEAAIRSANRLMAKDPSWAPMLPANALELKDVERNRMFRSGGQ